ncbi:MAG: hypothetical protein U5N86_09280 [Planctomycetota bacterium]|nr:hypothetical protein [Planctomycetota bacterium]
MTSWNKYWREKDPSKFKYTSQENIIIFEVKGSRIGFQVLNYSGHVIDEVENLRSVKHRRRRR